MMEGEGGWERALRRMGVRGEGVRGPQEDADGGGVKKQGPWRQMILDS